LTAVQTYQVTYGGEEEMEEVSDLFSSKNNNQTKIKKWDNNLTSMSKLIICVTHLWQIIYLF
jgi:hypothetical protein